MWFRAVVVSGPIPTGRKVEFLGRNQMFQLEVFGPSWAIKRDHSMMNVDPLVRARRKRGMIAIRYIMILVGLALVGTTSLASNPTIPLDRPAAVPSRVSTTMIFRVGDGKPRRLPVEGVVAKDGIHFRGTRRVEELDLVLAWDWTADLDPRGGGARVAGVLALLNDTSEERRFEVRVDFPLDPLIADASRLGGTVRATLVMNQGGGRVDLPAGEALFSALIDGKTVRRLHPGPFSMGGAQAGTTVADASFGAPYPSFETPAIHDAIGMMNRFSLSGGDQVQFRCELNIAGDPENFIRRRSTEPVRIEDNDDRIVIDVNGRTKRKTSRGSVSRNVSSSGKSDKPQITFD